MASITDIPDELLSHTKRAQFISWLHAIPLDRATTTHFILLWQTFTRSTLTNDERLILLRNRINPDGL